MKKQELNYPSGNRLDFHPLQTSDIGEIGDIQLINVTETEYMYRYNAKEWQDELGLNFYQEIILYQIKRKANNNFS